MKTITKKIVVSLVVMACMSFLLLGCSKKESKFVGNWTVESMSMGDQVINAADLGGDESLAASITVNKDGTLSMSMDNESNDGTWEEKDGKVTMTIDGDTVDVTLEDGKANISMEGVTLVFKKQ